MGMLYRRKKLDKRTGEKIETGPWWMKYYDNGHPILESTRKYEKREAKAVLKKLKQGFLMGSERDLRLIELDLMIWFCFFNRNMN